MKTRKRLAGAASGIMLSLSLAGAAHASGLEANGYDWELLFDPATYTAKGTVAYVGINHDLANTAFSPDGRTLVSHKDQIYFNFGIKADLAPNASCLVSAQNPWGTEVERDLTYAFAFPGGKAVSEKLTSLDLGLTCAYGIEMGPGIISLVGGVSAQTIKYEAELPTPFLTTAPLEIDGWGLGWRAGLAYEIPEYALRVSAIYNAAIDYEFEGTAFDGTLLSGPATAEETTPQSVEVNAQTGIAPGWLALASVKWTDWSVLQALDVDTTTAGTISSDLSYRDSWQLSAGIGHQVNEQLSLVGIVTWDQGASNPVSDDVYEASASMDRWGLSLGALYDVTEAVQFTGGVSVSTLADGSNLEGESWENGSIFAVSGGLKGSF
ncbi:OmpP1/FadL family transporter [Devosia nitrariae]|uniref:Long-chain fatty acid transporter n=1 Tax=Devosia nitrariae TaxID=2071872 RepID=A0ABQ5WC82_9HYPH|nr:outer membrane protein transport protein [Devosia nitrariae]GLQ57359.1 long-chain fatty acid transporter [Devosia nitrariae]